MVYAGMRHNSVRGELNSGTAALIDSGAAHHGRHGELLVLLSLVWKLALALPAVTDELFRGGALSRKNLLLAPISCMRNGQTPKLLDQEETWPAGRVCEAGQRRAESDEFVGTAVSP